MKRQKNSMLSTIVGLVLFLVITLIMVLSLFKLEVRSDSKQRSEDEYYHELESRFTSVLRMELEQDGYRNCGITISSIITPGLGREYTVKIHHEGLADLSEEEIEEYLENLSRVSFPDSACGVKYEILL